MDEQFWDRRYSERTQIWSGRPNGVLAAEATSLPPGRALDVGCGEGADARWLAQCGWEVTGIDVSQVALDRAAAATEETGVTWVRLDLATAAPARRSYDLVSVHYFPLPRQEGDTALRGLVDAVAPGGTLLVTSHDLADIPPHHDDGCDPAQFYRPDEIAALLDDAWTVDVHETRPRVDPTPDGTQHVRDVVLRARRHP